MEERKWENMNSDCLVNIFGRLDLESRLLDVPLVCKQWLQALLSPLCWQNLVFPPDMYQSRLANSVEDGNEVNISEIIKFVVGRSQGCVTKLLLPYGVTEQDLIYVSDECPALKILSVPYWDSISELIMNWKSLEVLKIEFCFSMLPIIDKLSLHCKNLIGLCVVHARIDHEVASAVVSKLPTIKALNLDEAEINKVNLMLILCGCKELEKLSVQNCSGFDDDDEEILKLASGIKEFKCEGSKNIDDFMQSYFDYANNISPEDIFKMASDLGCMGDGFSGDDYSV